MLRPRQLAVALAVFSSVAQAAPAQPRKKAPAAAVQPAPPVPALVLAARELPARTRFALFLQGEDAATTVRGFLLALGGARRGEPDGPGEESGRSLGIDLLSVQAQQDAGLHPQGMRVVAGAEDAVALVAPVLDEKKARRRLDAWLDQLGPARTVVVRKQRLLVSGAGRQVRAGLLADPGTGPRLWTASGRDAVAWLTALVQPASGKERATLAAEPLLADALSALHGPLSVWARGSEALLGAALDVDLRDTGLVAQGRLLLLDARPLLAGAIPSAEACAGSPLLCVRAAPGPGLRALAAAGLHQLVLKAVPAARRDELDLLVQATLASARGGALLRVESIDWTAALAAEPALTALSFLLASRAPGAALPPVPVRLEGLCVRALGELALAGAPCPEAAPPGLAAEGPTELVARFEPKLFLPRRGLSPLDALRSPAGGALLALQAIAGPLFARSGALTLTLRPLPAGADSRSVFLELHWPLEPLPAP